MVCALRCCAAREGVYFSPVGRGRTVRSPPAARRSRLGESMPCTPTLNGLRRTAIGALLAATFTATLPVVAAAQAPFPGLDQYVTQAMRTWKVPGLSIAIVRNDSVLYTKGFGVVAAGGAPVNDQTLFEIGSSTKAFTATLIAMLVSDGKMHYDDRMTQYLPSFALYDPVASAELTIRDALTHRSGLARGELAWLGSSGSRDDVLHRLRFLKPESPFRSRWSYQNMMYLAAGQAAGVAGGSSWDDLVKQRILGPLGMTSTLVDLAQPPEHEHRAAPWHHR